MWHPREMFPKDEPLAVSVFMIFLGLLLLVMFPFLVCVHYFMKLMGVKDGLFY